MAGIFDVVTYEKLRDYLIESGGRHNNYRHYTNMEGIYGILNSGTLWLTKGSELNDKQEIQNGDSAEWKKIYILSFRYGTSENVAMWGLYGLPHDEAVSLSFPKSVFTKWIGSISEIYDTETGSKIDVGFKTTLTDVAYLGGRPNDDNATVSVKDGNIAASKFIRDPNAGHFISREPMLTGFLKSFAWAYENEVRIRIRLDHPINQNRIAIKIPDDVLRNTKDSCKMTICYGPWCTYKNEPDKAAIFKNKVKDIDPNFIDKYGQWTRSDFLNLVKYREVCHYCAHTNNERLLRKENDLFKGFLK